MPSYNQLLAQAQQLLTRGQLAPAEGLFRQVLSLRPRNADALAGLGAVCNATGRHAEAIELLKQAVAIQPYSLVAHASLGAAYHATGRFEEAEGSFRQFLTLQPQNASMHYNLAMALKGQRRREEAVAAYQRALELKPDYADAWYNLGNVYRDLGKFADSVHAYEQALKWNPHFPEGMNNLGQSLANLGRMDEAIAMFRRAMAVRPGFLDSMTPLANALSAVGRNEDAEALFRQYLQMRPHDLAAHQSLLFMLHYLTPPAPQRLFEEHLRWGERFVPAGTERRPHANDRSPERRLRVGYISCDFREHSVAFFLEGLFAAHDPAVVETFCYNTNSYVDQVTTRLQRLVHHWRDATRLEDAAFIDRIREDQIDILVDLNGHTAGSRVLILGQKPAPVQVAYLGYPDTTGMREMDYRLTDAYADPPGLTDRFYTERLVRLPRTFLSYRPPDYAPPVRAPREPGRAVTFCSFNAFPKINASLVGLWAQVLKRVPESRLLVKARALAAASAGEHLLALLGQEGIASDRVDLHTARDSRVEHLDLYNAADIALDAFPYCGTTTTCEALWMGVPVVSLAGETHASRVGVSLLSNAGLPELVARSGEEYVEIAAALAADRARVAELRATMRQRLRGSPLMDYAGFAREVEQAYRTMWREWVARGA